MNKYSGSNFDDFLKEEGILEDVSAKAQKRLLNLQLSDIILDNVDIMDSLKCKLQVHPSSEHLSKSPA